MAKEKKIVSETDIRIYEVEFYVQKDRKEAFAHFCYERRRKKDVRDLMVDFPLVSLWCDDSNRAIRAHLKLERNRRQITFYNDVLRQRAVNPTYERGMSLLASTASAQRVLVYGVEGDTPYGVYDYDISDQVYYYPTKAQALRAVIRNVETHRSIGGLNFASLQSCADDVLIQIGFRRLDDMLGRGLPMWVGSPKIFKSHDWSRDRASLQREMADSFLLMLNEELQKNRDTNTKEAA